MSKGTPWPFSWGVQVAREVDAYAYVEMSSLTGHNVDHLFPLLLEAVFASKDAIVPQKTKCSLQ